LHRATDTRHRRWSLRPLIRRKIKKTPAPNVARSGACRLSPNNRKFKSPSILFRDQRDEQGAACRQTAKGQADAHSPGHSSPNRTHHDAKERGGSDQDHEANGNWFHVVFSCKPHGRLR
jgi:hypothetical protein